MLVFFNQSVATCYTMQLALTPKLSKKCTTAKFFQYKKFASCIKQNVFCTLNQHVLIK